MTSPSIPPLSPAYTYQTIDGPSNQNLRNNTEIRKFCGNFYDNEMTPLQNMWLAIQNETFSPKEIKLTGFQFDVSEITQFNPTSESEDGHVTLKLPPNVRLNYCVVYKGTGEFHHEYGVVSVEFHHGTLAARNKGVRALGIGCTAYPSAIGEGAIAGVRITIRENFDLYAERTSYGEQNINMSFLDVPDENPNYAEESVEGITDFEANLTFILPGVPIGLGIPSSAENETEPDAAGFTTSMINARWAAAEDAVSNVKANPELVEHIYFKTFMNSLRKYGKLNAATTVDECYKELRKQIGPNIIDCTPIANEIPLATPDSAASDVKDNTEQVPNIDWIALQKAVNQRAKNKVLERNQALAKLIELANSGRANETMPIILEAAAKNLAIRDDVARQIKFRSDIWTALFNSDYSADNAELIKKLPKPGDQEAAELLKIAQQRPKSCAAVVLTNRNGNGEKINSIKTFMARESPANQEEISRIFDEESALLLLIELKKTNVKARDFFENLGKGKHNLIDALTSNATKGSFGAASCLLEFVESFPQPEAWDRLENLLQNPSLRDKIMEKLVLDLMQNPQRTFAKRPDSVICSIVAKLLGLLSSKLAARKVFRNILDSRVSLLDSANPANLLESNNPLTVHELANSLVRHNSIRISTLKGLAEDGEPDAYRILTHLAYYDPLTFEWALDQRVTQSPLVLDAFTYLDHLCNKPAGMPLHIFIVFVMERCRKDPSDNTLNKDALDKLARLMKTVTAKNQTDLTALLLKFEQSNRLRELISYVDKDVNVLVVSGFYAFALLGNDAARQEIRKKAADNDLFKIAATRLDARHQKTDAGSISNNEIQFN